MAHERTVIALFANREDAHRAVSDLLRAGFPAERVGYLEPSDVLGVKSPWKRAASGIRLGAATGAVVGGVLGAAVVAIPGVGPALVAGALVPIVVGMVTGGATGALEGGLVGSETADAEEPYFMEEIQAGRVLVSAEVPDATDEAKAAEVLRGCGPLEVDSLGTARLHARLHRPSS